MLDIYLLGNFRLEVRGERVIHSLTPRMQSLVGFLLLNQGIPQSRSQLASLLWPDTGEGQARTNLRNLLHRIRNSVPIIEPFLTEDHGLVWWRSQGDLRLDVNEFNTLVGQAANSEAKADLAAEQYVLKAAEQAYGGDLLPGIYDDWILPHRESLHQKYLAVLDRLSSLSEIQQDFRQAIHYSQLTLRLDPLNEAIYRKLIRYHGLCGDRTGGLRVYQACTAVLQQELGIDPDPATRAVVEEMIQGLPGPQPKPDRSAPARTGQGGIPFPLTSFIGREKELAELHRQIQHNRLITLVGPPGAGKTRLAIELGRQLNGDSQNFPDGVWWIDLTEVADLNGVSAEAAATLGVREVQGDPMMSSLIDHLRDRAMLLVMDNAEHVMEAVREVADSLLNASPRLRLLVTSREALGIPGEVVWDLPALSYPTQMESVLADTDITGFPESILSFDAVRLFADRASAAMPTFRLTGRNARAVVQICQQLQGIPLAIELASARVRMMTPDQILERLQGSMDILKASRGRGSPRHQTLESAIDWSYRLLTESEKTFLGRLSVFAGGFSLDGAGFVTGAIPAGEGGVEKVVNLVSDLIDKSLIRVDDGEPGGEVRYSLLEMIRRFAAARLHEAGEEDETARQHTRFCIWLAEEADRQVRGPEQTAWLNRLEMEHENFRKSLRWVVANEDGEAGLLLVNSLWQFWDIRGYFREGRQWINKVLQLKGDPTPQRAKAYKAAGALAWSQSDYPEAHQMMLESLKIYRELGEKRDVAVGLFNLGLVTYSQREYAAAVPIVQESLTIFKEIGHQQGIANALNSLGVIASAQGDYDRARPYYEESLAIRHELGDKRGLAIAYGNLGVAAMHQGHLEEAEALMSDGLAIYSEIGDKRGFATSLSELGQLATRQGQFASAFEYYRQSVAVWQELGSKEGLAGAFEGIAAAAAESEREQAVTLLSAAGALREVCGTPLLPSDLPAYQELLNRLQAEIPAETFARAWREGRTLSATQVFELAGSLR